jgi:UDP:flavonoid glycosyltransferase YjiC (YdhE family)
VASVNPYRCDGAQRPLEPTAPSVPVVSRLFALVRSDCIVGYGGSFGADRWGFPLAASVDLPRSVHCENSMKALFVPFGPSLAHVSRCLTIAEAWCTQGHTAIFAVGTERVEMVQNAGYETHPLPEVPGDVFRADQGFRWLTREYVEQNITGEQDILANAQPDVVVLDFRFTTALSAHLAGLPSVSIVHGNALRLAQQPRETAQLLLGDSKNMSGIAALRLGVMRQLFPMGFQLFMRSAVRSVNVMRRKHGLQPVNSPFELLLGDEIIVADIPSLLPSELPPNCTIVGPLMWSGWTQPAPWLDELDTQPLIYVTMGSTVEAQSTLVKIIDALGNAPYNVIVSTGGLSLPTNLGLPSHIRVFSTVPGEAVVKRSVAVIHHGGHGTLMQVLKAGVPSVMLPANPDQILVAQQVQALGAGRTLWRTNGLPLDNKVLDEMTSNRIRGLIDEVITDQDCARACEMLKREIERYQDKSVCVTILERAAIAEPGPRQNAG